MKFILGTKQNMSQVFTETGVVPVTIIKTGPNTVTFIKTKEKDGYDAVAIGFGEKDSKKISKAEKGHLKDLGAFKFIKEFQPGNIEQKIGDKITPEIFKEGDVVEVSSVSKGKGFQGVVKRHGFGGGPRSHGQKHSEREPGSIGGGLRTGPRKGMRMAGRMGSDRTTVKNLKIVAVDKENNLIAVSGAIAGRRGSLVEIKSKA